MNMDEFDKKIQSDNYFKTYSKMDHKKKIEKNENDDLQEFSDFIHYVEDLNIEINQ